MRIAAYNCMCGVQVSWVRLRNMSNPGLLAVGQFVFSSDSRIGVNISPATRQWSLSIMVSHSLVWPQSDLTVVSECWRVWLWLVRVPGQHLSTPRTQGPPHCSRSVSPPPPPPHLYHSNLLQSLSVRSWERSLSIWTLVPLTPSTARSCLRSPRIISSGISTASRFQSSQPGEWLLWWRNGRAGAQWGWRGSVWPSPAPGSVGPATPSLTWSPWLYWTVSRNSSHSARNTEKWHFFYLFRDLS